MELELYLSHRARRERFTAGERSAECVRIDVKRAALEPHTRALLFDTFGDGLTRVAPELLRVDSVPESDWEFHHFAHVYKAANARWRWRRRLRYGLYFGASAMFAALLTSPVLGSTGLILLTVVLYTAVAIFGLVLA